MYFLSAYRVKSFIASLTQPHVRFDCSQRCNLLIPFNALQVSFCVANIPPPSLHCSLYIPHPGELWLFHIIIIFLNIPRNTMISCCKHFPIHSKIPFFVKEQNSILYVNLLVFIHPSAGGALRRWHSLALVKSEYASAHSKLTFSSQWYPVGAYGSSVFSILRTCMPISITAGLIHILLTMHSFPLLWWRWYCLFWDVLVVSSSD